MRGKKPIKMDTFDRKYRTDYFSPQYSRQIYYELRQKYLHLRLMRGKKRKQKTTKIFVIQNQ